MKKILYAVLFMTGPLSADPVTEENLSMRAHGINEFAFDFYKQADTNKNLCFSPYSIFTALSLAGVGAKGTTAEEIEKVLHSKLGETITHSSGDSFYSLNIASALWINQGTSILPSYLSLAKESFDAKISTLDFSNKEATALEINTWVSKSTKKQINTLLGPSDISSSKLILTNAIYFQGSWALPFKKENTKKEVFYTEDKASVFVNMMEQTGHFPYHENDDLEILLIPIKAENARYASFFILPKETSFGSLENSFTAALFGEWIQSAKPCIANLKLPRFTVKSRLHPKDTLIAMGIQSAFSSSADFSGISEERNLQIDKIIHEALFKIDEAGVTAAAATAIPFITTHVRVPKEPTIFFHANRPFLFGIVDLNSGLVLFLGKMTDP